VIEIICPPGNAPAGTSSFVPSSSIAPPDALIIRVSVAPVPVGLGNSSDRHATITNTPSTTTRAADFLIKSPSQFVDASTSRQISDRERTATTSIRPSLLKSREGLSVFSSPRTT
jgi:hypothetical protein